MEESQALYHDLYFGLFNRVTDAIRALDGNQPDCARELLRQAQRDAEERFVNLSE